MTLKTSLNARSTLIAGLAAVTLAGCATPPDAGAGYRGAPIDVAPGYYDEGPGFYGPGYDGPAVYGGAVFGDRYGRRDRDRRYRDDRRDRDDGRDRGNGGDRDDRRVRDRAGQDRDRDRRSDDAGPRPDRGREPDANTRAVVPYNGARRPDGERRNEILHCRVGPSGSCL